MRLDLFRERATVPAKIAAQLVRFVAGFDPDIVRMLLYRKEFFGEKFNEGFFATLRDESEWSMGERELMAAFVSRKNECRYCTDIHTATAARFLGETEVEQVLEQREFGKHGDQLRAIFAFLEKLTLSPKQISKSDIADLRSVGLSDDQIRQAAAICAQFCIINRLADTFGFRLETPKQLANHAKLLSKRHYKF